jgi:ATP-binding cassette subfamily F protein 3
MLQLISAAKRFGHKALFEDVDWQINPGDHIGLVGGNGTGKSTLLRILCGLEPLDEGSLESAGGLSTGYLPQDGLRLLDRTVMEECMSAFQSTRDIEKVMESTHRQIAELAPDSPEYRAAAARLEKAQTQFLANDGYAMEARAGAVLAGLGFSKNDWSRKTGEFSGGWQMRIAMARLLLETPDVLLLDEPTNHLDLEARNWLEGYLRSYPNAYVLVSHDRYFLDVSTEKIAELWNRRLYVYRGNYEKYRQQKHERLTQLEAAYRRQRTHIEHLEAFIRRFRAQATKARQVQSRIKELERIERIELPASEPEIHFTFPQPAPSGRTVVEAQGLAKSFDDHEIFGDVHFTIERGDRVALIGPNGAGKSTLIRLLAGLEEATAGEIRPGHNVRLQYFAQDQARELDPNDTLIGDIGRAAPRIPETDLRSLLGCFLFSGDDVSKRLGVLSGGERNRYAVARLLVGSANFLLLDEPTNHLDLRAKDVLQEALRNYSGTLVFVSHDRAFLDAVATRVFEIREGTLRIYPGNYEDYLWQTAREAEVQTANGSPSSPPPPTATDRRQSTSEPAADPVLPPASQKKRMNPIRLRQMQERCQVLEEEIPRVEASIQTTEQDMATFTSAERFQEQTRELESLREEHAALLAEWEELTIQIEEQATLA